MRAQRIKTGFHRIGLMLAVVCIVPGAVSILASGPLYLGWFHERNQFDDAWQGFLAGGVLGIVLGGLGYLAAWALGWIVAGFAGDGEISN